VPGADVVEALEDGLRAGDGPRRGGVDGGSGSAGPDPV
jgi:hypothetical protein